MLEAKDICHYFVGFLGGSVAILARLPFYCPNTFSCYVPHLPNDLGTARSQGASHCRSWGK